MNDPSIKTEAVTEREVAGIDWAEEFQPSNHAVKTKIAPGSRSLIDLTTGEEIVKLPEEYRWYWFHSHLHVRRKEYSKSADEQEALRLQGDQPHRTANPEALVGLALGYLTKAMAKIKQDRTVQAVSPDPVPERRD